MSSKRKRDNGDGNNTNAVDATAHPSIQSYIADLRKKLEDLERADPSDGVAGSSPAHRPTHRHLREAAKESVVLELNVGGRDKITVTRRVLTHFPDSVLAAKFSGRWDDSLEKDKEGNFFIDFDASDFIKLIEYLRLHTYKARNDEKFRIPAPTPTFRFCSMLDYYNLMPAIYPSLWYDGHHDIMQQMGYGRTPFRTNETYGAAHYFDCHKYYEGLTVSSFTVLVDGSECILGWSSREAMKAHLEGSWPVDWEGGSDDDDALASFEVNIISGCFFRNERGLPQDFDLGCRDSLITCSFDGYRRYTISAVPVPGEGPEIPEISHSEIADFPHSLLFPYIWHVGKATLVNLEYHYPSA